MQAIDTSNQTTQIQQSSLMAEANSYRMVNKSYYCYGCNKKYKKMMQVHDFNENGIECDHCGSDFCEAISSDSGLDQFLQAELPTENMTRPPRPQTTRENIRDHCLESDQFGRPLSRQQRHEEAKQEERPSPPASPPTSSPQHNQRSHVRVLNPFDSMFQHMNMMDNLFSDPFFNGGRSSFFDESEFGLGYQQNFRSSHRGQSQRQQQPNMVFRIISNGDDLGMSHRGFGFESFADLINAHMQRQPDDGRRPTSESVVNQLPVQKIEEKHCKKDCKGGLEAPTCSVCITDFEMGQEGMFLPCGHTFHPDCIKPWLKNNDKCPVCRKELPKN